MIMAAWAGAVAAAAGGQAASPPFTVHSTWSEFQPRFTRHICPFGAGLEYDPSEFVCGYVLVPEDRADPDSRLIKLSVLKIRSPIDDPPAGALVRLTGGPGKPSLSAGRIRAYQAPENRFIREAADLVFFDQRGVGYSGAEFCRAIPLSHQFGVPTSPGGTDRLVAAMNQCLDEARARGVAVDAYATWHSALDVKDIRRALGYERWNLFGVSYGTALAQAVMAVDAAGVRSAVLDSVLPLVIDPEDPASTLAAGFRSSLDAIDAMCREDPACAAAYRSLSERFEAVFRAYEAQPLVLRQVDRTKAQGGQLTVDGTLAAGAVFQALYRREVYGNLPALLRVLERRDTEALKAYVRLLGYSIDHAYGHGLSWVANCRGASRDRGGAEALAAIARQEPDLSRWTGTIPFDRHCDAVYPGPRDAQVEPLRSDIPILVLAGRADPITPPHFGRRILPGLSRATYVEFPYAGHGVALQHFTGCGGQLLREFIIEPASELDVSCAQQTPPPEFLTGLRETKGPYRLALGLRGGDYPLPLLAVAGGLGAVLLGFPCAAVARRIDGGRSAGASGPRVLAWSGAAMTLAGFALALRMILHMAGTHAAALPAGVPASIAWGGWFGVAGLALAGLGAVRLGRSGSQARCGVATRVGVYASAAFSACGLWLLIGIGAGPI